MYRQTWRYIKSFFIKDKMSPIQYRAHYYQINHELYKLLSVVY